LRVKIVIILSLFTIICLLASGCGSGIYTSPSIDQDSETSLGEDFILVHNDNQQNNILFALGKKNEDALALLGEKDTEGNPVSVTGMIYVLEKGELFAVEARADGLPKFIYDSNGNKIVFENYTESTVDISIYNSENLLIQESTTKNINQEEIIEIKNLYETINNKERERWNKQNTASLLKWGGKITSGIICATTIASTISTGGLLSPAIILACGSAVVGVAVEFTPTEADDSILTSIGVLSFATGDFYNGTVSLLEVGDVVLDITSNIIEESFHSPIILELTAEPSSINLNETSRITCDAMDEDGDNLEYSWSKTDGTFEDNTSPIWPNITWRAPSIEGNYTITCEVSDGKKSDSEQVVISVVDINHPPEITSNAVTSATKGDSYVYDVDATDADVDDTLTYSLTTHPSGMSINPSTGLITWIPSVTGNYNVTVKVSDGDLFDTQAFSITVSSVALDTFTISASAGSNGSINPSGDVIVNEGSDQTFVITPDNNYQINAVVVDGYIVGKQSLFTFTNINNDHTITANFNELENNISSTINAYTPTSKITVDTGQSFNISCSFTNTGNTSAYFYPGVSIWNSSGSLVYSEWGNKKYLSKNQQGSASWGPTINTAGEYWLQFGIWDEAKNNLLDKKPSPSQNLIRIESGIPKPNPPTPLSPGSSFSPGTTISDLIPTMSWQTVSNADYYDLAISIYPYGSSNVVYTSPHLYGSSKTIPSGILESGKKYRWNMQAHNSAGSSDVSSTLYFQTESTTVSAIINTYSPSSKITVDTGESFPISCSFTNTGNTSAYFYPGVSIWNSSGSLVFTEWGSKKYLSKNQQGSESWSPTINTAGEYWLQFGIWDEAKSVLLDKEPSPSQNLIKVELPVQSAPEVTGVDPSQPTVSPYRQYIDILGNNFASNAQITLQISSSVYSIPDDRTYFINSARIEVYVGLTDSGYWKVWVTNPDGQKSNEYVFYVKP